MSSSSCLARTHKIPDRLILYSQVVLEFSVVVNRIVAFISPEEVTEISKKEKVASEEEDDDESVSIRLVPSSKPSPLSLPSPLSSSFSALFATVSTTPYASS